jgi:G2/mitotic-specific cyclin 2
LSSSIAPVRGGATAATAASKAKASDAKADLAAGKRKREALGEVTSLVTNNKGKDKAAGVKEKETGGLKEKFDGVVIKTKATTTTTSLRQPTRFIGSTLKRVTRTNVTAQTQALDNVVEVPDEDAMAVDDQPAFASRRVSARSAGSSHRLQVQEQVDDAEATRVFKKRRTSSEAPVSEAQMFEEELRRNSDVGAADLEVFADEEREADPEGDEWDDLDAEDADDPLMVSEYVVEIFKYMKEMEVYCLFFHNVAIS